MAGVVGIDIGGTFTDLVHIDTDTGKVSLDKVSSRHGALHEGIRDGLASLERRHGIRAADISTVVHGTTVATNAVLEGKLPRTALIMTQGFGDVLEIGTMLRPHLYDQRARKKKPLVERADVLEARERVNSSGVSVEALADAEIGRLVAEIGRINPKAVGICLLFSFLNPEHERRIAAALREAYPGLSVAMSSDVDPQPREFARANTTILNASLNPLISDYVARFTAVLDSLDGEQSFLIMQSNGGLIPPGDVGRNAHRLILSGPAGGVVAAQRVVAAHGERNLITFDMGGTSSDLCLIADGQAALQLAPSPLDMQPVRTSSLSVHAVGAGGGSIASVDEDGTLSVGPQSAGSIPGPVCYARGGEDPTVTDAQLVLGRLSPAGLLGGDMPLDRQASEDVIRTRIAEPMGISVEAAALAIMDVAVATMERGLRVVSVNAGYDPRDFVLVAYGGGGPLHAADLAASVGIRRVVVPPASSAFSALGMLCADLTQDYSETVGIAVEDMPGEELLGRFDRLAGLAKDFLAKGAGGRLARFADMRFFGQNGVMRVDIPEDADPSTLIDAIAERFLAAHRREYGHASAEDPIEVASIRVVATRPWSERGVRIERGDIETVAPQLPGRQVYFAGTGWADCNVIARGDQALAAGIAGPAIVEDRESTTVVPPGSTVRSDDLGSLILELA